MNVGVRGRSSTGSDRGSGKTWEKGHRGGTNVRDRDAVVDVSDAVGIAKKVARLLPQGLFVGAEEGEVAGDARPFLRPSLIVVFNNYGEDRVANSTMMAKKASVLVGKYGPCCSVESMGMRGSTSFFTASFTSGQLNSL
jgi:hypothetical protein